MEHTVQIERVIDLPRAIVADALVDPVLLEGWLHPTLHLSDFPDVTLSIEQVPGGTRGTSTRVRVEATVPDARFQSAITETWQTRLDQLENLLRGHPVVWQAEQTAPARARHAN
jgi:uncharacterized protein YndB with AHSA1/START domain